MRIIIFILLAAFVLSGYSTATHAAGSDCNNAIEKAELNDCDDQPSNSDKPDHPVCHDICTSWVGFSHDINLPVYEAQNTSTFKITALTGDFLYSLLRPPKNLV